MTRMSPAETAPAAHPAPPATVGRAAFWTPERVSGPDRADHAPVLMWLAETQAPATVLGLGLVTGDGYFAVAQALAGAGLPARLWGHGEWPDGVPAALAAHNAARHRDCSRLTVANALEALGRYGAGLFDLILIETAGLNDADPQILAPRLAKALTPRGVIVLQGGDASARTLAAALADAAGRGGSAAVIRFGAATDGALVLAGPAVDPRLAALGAAPDDPAGLPAMLARLGQAAKADPRAAAAHPAAAALAASDALRLRTVRILTGELEQLAEALRETRDGAASERQAAASAAEAALAELRIRHFDEIADLESERDWMARDLAAARAEVAALQGRIAALSAELAAQQAAAADLKAALSDARAGTEAAWAAHAAAERAHEHRLRQLRDEAAARAARDRLLLRLRDWKIAQLANRGRGRRARGPSGGLLRAEIAAVAAHPLFDADWYRATYPDVAASNMDPVAHFLQHGLFEGRDPGPRLRLLDWFAAHPDAVTERRNPLLDPALAPAD